MGNSTAYVLLKTGDLTEAHALVRRLLALTTPYADPRHAMFVQYDAEFDDAESALRLLAVLPGAKSFDADFEPVVDDSSIPGAHPPIEFALWDAVPDEGRETAFLAAIGRASGSLSWHSFLWPEHPDPDCRPVQKYSAVQIAIHADDIYFDEPGPDHTVFLHMRAPDDYAAWLVGRVGATVIGPRLHGW